MSLQKKIGTLTALLKQRGLVGTLKNIYHNFFYYPVKDKEKLVSYFNGLKGIEIGGPSKIYEKTIPVYQRATQVDGVNFSSQTVWEGTLTEGLHYHYAAGKNGYQYILDGVQLDGIADASYDFCLSCNNLEHIANPIKALLEWKRVLKKDGLMFLILPNKEHNFDHKRPYTSFEHILDDYQKKMGENDMTHFDEITRLHDLKKDLRAGNYEVFVERCKDNISNRCMHHHVYNQQTLAQLMNYAGIDVLYQDTNAEEHLILGRCRAV